MCKKGIITQFQNVFACKCGFSINTKVTITTRDPINLILNN